MPIAKTVIIGKRTKIGSGTSIGDYSVVMDGVHLGKSCRVGRYVVIYSGAHIGEGARIDDHAVIGKQPLRARNSVVTKLRSSAGLNPPSIGNRVLIGTHAVVYAGARLEDDVMVADSAAIREEVSIGRGTIVGWGAYVENRCRIGQSCKIEANAYIAALSEIADFVFIAPGVVTTNDNFIGRTQERFKRYKGVVIKRGGRIGAQATILPGRTINADSLIGAGAVVTRDVSGKTVVTGVPARKLKDVPTEQWLENQNKRKS